MAGKTHSPAENCLTCHAPHHSAQARLAVQPLHEMCSQCHELGDKAFTTAHLGIAPKDINCVSCHDPHASQDPMLFKKTVHAPFAARQCDACHVTDKK